MKAPVIFLFLLFSLSAGCNNATNAPTSFQLTEDDEILVAVFKHQFLHNASGQQQTAKVYFLMVRTRIDSSRWQDSDPGAELMHGFVGHIPPVKPYSACRFGDRGVYDTLTMDQGLLFRTEAIRRITSDSVEVNGGYYEAGESASGNVYTLRRSFGVWKVVGDVMLWIS
jgi:hypothetical protein